MGPSTDHQGNRGTLANELFVSVHSSLAPVGAFLAATGRFGLASGAVAAEVTVIADPAAPQKRFLLDEYYTRIVWQDATHAEVHTNGATASIDWSGRALDVLKAELRIYPEGAPESLGVFLNLLTSLLLPSRSAVLIHASGVVVEGEGLVFLGESGAGKTTTARRAGREGALRIADDLAVVRIENGAKEPKITVEADAFPVAPEGLGRCEPLMISAKALPGPRLEPRASRWRAGAQPSLAPRVPPGRWIHYFRWRSRSAKLFLPMLFT
jgi:hypothetical protein